MELTQNNLQAHSKPCPQNYARLLRLKIRLIAYSCTNVPPIPVRIVPPILVPNIPL